MVSRRSFLAGSSAAATLSVPPFGILGYYEGYVAKPELPTNVYRVDANGGAPTVTTGDVQRPNGLAFSPDESKLYVVEAGTTPRAIVVFDAVGGTRLANKRKFIDPGPGTPDGSRCDVDGNLWCGWGTGRRGWTACTSSTPTAS